MRNQQLTYLDLPPDAQKAPKPPPEAKVLSDKNRIAESRHPTSGQEDAGRAEARGPAGAAGAAGTVGADVAADAAGRAAAAEPIAEPADGAAPAGSRNPKLPMPSQGSSQAPVNFARHDEIARLKISPQQAARAVASRRGGGSYGGGGDYGVGPGGSARTLGNLEVLSDTQGVDFGPYLSRVLDAVRRNWYILIPEEARAPLMKRGKLAIEFVILPDGKIAGMKLVAPSGDVCAGPRGLGRNHRLQSVCAVARRIPRALPGVALPLLLQPAKGRYGVVARVELGCGARPAARSQVRFRHRPDAGRMGGSLPFARAHEARGTPGRRAVYPCAGVLPLRQDDSLGRAMTAPAEAHDGPAASPRRNLNRCWLSFSDRRPPASPHSPSSLRNSLPAKLSVAIRSRSIAILRSAPPSRRANSAR